MAIITFIMGLIVGWKGWKFFFFFICWTFIILFIANLIAIAKSGNVGESIAFVLMQFIVAAVAYCITYGITYVVHGKKVKKV